MVALRRLEEEWEVMRRIVIKDSCHGHVLLPKRAITSIVVQSRFPQPACQLAHR
jgi:hypothetical protein